MFYLCKTDGSILGVMSGLKIDSVSLTKKITDFWELTFSVARWIDEDGVLVQSDYYDSIDELMQVYDDIEKIYYIIDSEPEIANDGNIETKNVTAHSCECELNHKYLSNFKVNNGTSDSLEYLAEGNIDDYTKLPKEYIQIVNYENPELSLMHLCLENTEWQVSEDIEEDICTMKYAFDSNDDIYTFLLKSLSPLAKLIVIFDRLDKKINLVKASEYGEDTGVYISIHNLLKSVDVSSSSQDSIMTKIFPSGSEDLNVRYVNFGQDYIEDYDYFFDTKNEYDDYKFVSNILHDKYHTWKDYRDHELVPYYNKEVTRRELYAEYTKSYNQKTLDINELRNRLPNDGCSIDYLKWKYDELQEALIAYRNALKALVEIYKLEYGVESIGEAPDYEPVPSTATNIKSTIYWIDFESYNQIIEKVIEAHKQWVKTDEKGNFLYDDDGNYIYLETGNPYYYNDTTIVKEVNDWLYDFSLYGSDELSSKIKAWNETASILFDKCFIKEGTVADPISYITKDDWDSLTAEDKGRFSSSLDFTNRLESYLDYMSFEERENSLTKRVNKGVIVLCKEALKDRENEIKDLQEEQSEIQALRTELANSVIMSNFKVDGENLFTEEELTIVKRFVRETNYENSNYVTTNLDDIVSIVDIQEQLYQDSLIHLSEISQPQYSFKAQISNLYCIEEFAEYIEPFVIGNFIYVNIGLYQDEWVKMRVITETKNPLIDDQTIEIEFSTMTKSLEGISDLAFLLDDSGNGTASSSSSSSSSSSDGVYGTNDAQIQISNNMLNALLKTDNFNSAIQNSLLNSITNNTNNFSTLLSSVGLFNTISVTGDAIVGGFLKSENYSEENKTGSLIDLSNGQFSFGGGKLVFDGTSLTVNGYATTADNEEAKKSATDFLAKTTSGSIVIGNMADASATTNTIIDYTGMAVRIGEEEVARFSNEESFIGIAKPDLNEQTGLPTVDRFTNSSLGLLKFPKTDADSKSSYILGINARQQKYNSNIIEDIGELYSNGTLILTPDQRNEKDTYISFSSTTETSSLSSFHLVMNREKFLTSYPTRSSGYQPLYNPLIHEPEKITELNAGDNSSLYISSGFATKIDVIHDNVLLSLRLFENGGGFSDKKLCYESISVDLVPGMSYLIYIRDYESFDMLNNADATTTSGMYSTPIISAKVYMLTVGVLTSDTVNDCLLFELGAGKKKTESTDNTDTPIDGQSELDDSIIIDESGDYQFEYTSITSTKSLRFDIASLKNRQLVTIRKYEYNPFVYTTFGS